MICAILPTMSLSPTSLLHRSPDHPLHPPIETIMRVSHIILPNIGIWISFERRKPGQRGFSMLPLQACFAQKGSESVFQKVSRERIYAGLRVGFCSVLD